MIFRKMTLQYFRSFKDPQIFLFPKRPGFYSLSSENKTEPDLGANGCGKSSLWDGLSWIIYDKTSRGLRAGDIANWDGEGITVGSLEFEKEDRLYTLERTWKPNSLTLTEKGSKPETVTQGRVEELIGMDHPTFLSTILMGQFNRFFFDLSPAEKLQRFSEALGLDFWVEQSKKANTLASEADQEIRKLEKEEAGLESTISVLSQQIKSEKNRQGNGNDLRDLRRSLKVLKRKAQGLEEKYRPFRKLRGKSQRKLDALERSINSAHREEKQTDQEYRERSRTIDLKTFTRDRIEKDLKLLKESPKICHACGQKMSPMHLKRERSRLEGELKTAQDEITVALAHESSAKDRHARASQELTALLDRLEETKRKISRYQSKWMTGQTRIKALTEQISRTQGEIDREESKQRLQEQRLKDLREQRAKAKQRIETVQKDLIEERKKLLGYGHWVKGFKDLRLWIIEESLAQLEIEVSNSLLQLGLTGWKIGFDVEKASKQGAITRGFTVTVTPPNRSKPVKWESWSGGETQRLRIAGAIGFANLIRSRRGIDPHLEVWDEPTAHLSEQGIHDLLTFFEGRSREEKRQIWFVDHRSLKAGNFDGEVRIVKEKGGAKISSGRSIYGYEQ